MITLRHASVERRDREKPGKAEKTRFGVNWRAEERKGKVKQRR
ncbi:hypothetical protein [Pantoea ananatis]|nr:hypothetical protein [Pantoea ananatis]